MERRATYTLSQTEEADLPAKVTAILERHTSRNPITGKCIARLLHYRDDRKVRIIIQRLISEGKPIAASVRAPMGYYLISSPKEAEDYVATLRSRASKTFRRLHDVQQAVKKSFGVPYQPLLFPIDTAEVMRQADENETW